MWQRCVYSICLHATLQLRWWTSLNYSVIWFECISACFFLPCFHRRICAPWRSWSSILFDDEHSWELWSKLFNQQGAYLVITFSHKIRLLFSSSTSQPSCSSFVHLMCASMITSLLFGGFGAWFEIRRMPPQINIRSFHSGVQIPKLQVVYQVYLPLKPFVTISMNWRLKLWSINIHTPYTI